MNRVFTIVKGQGLGTPVEPAPSILNPYPWEKHGLCFKDTYWHTYTTRIQKSVCADCPVRNLCRDKADTIEKGEHHRNFSEVYAGETPVERWERRNGITRVTATQKQGKRTRQGGRLLTDGKWLCKNGHDKSIVGVRSSGVCNACHQLKQAEKQKPKDDGKWLCKNGHDKSIVGITKNRSCRECRRIKYREYAARRREERLATQTGRINGKQLVDGKWLCLRGHDKNVVGVNHANACMECRRLASVGLLPDIQTVNGRILTDGRWLCKRGHDKNVVGADKRGVCKECKRERMRRRAS